MVPVRPSPLVSVGARGAAPAAAAAAFLARSGPRNAAVSSNRFACGFSCLPIPSAVTIATMTSAMSASGRVP
jgi:hypothetical protein